MTKIQKLSQELINKIAAGEVVERPASVVKELIENSLDAGASRIVIEIENGGMSKINVTDDGYGMDKEDLKKAVERHATSKITSIDDLQKINSFGFRGEALSSIAAVSMMTIKSKTQDSALGYQVILRGGQLEKESKIGMPSGTQVLATDLFFSVPARKKFLKSTNTETRHVIDVVTNCAIINHNVGFLLTHNKRPIFDLPKNQNQKDRLLNLFSNTITNQLIPFQYDDPHFSLSGFIAKPQVEDVTSRQFIFVNRRPVNNKIIAAAVRTGFGNITTSRSNPMFFIFWKIPAELVDVNVHPRKEEVRFVNAQTIFSITKQAVAYALGDRSQSSSLPKFPIDQNIRETVISRQFISNISPSQDFRKSIPLTRNQLPKNQVEQLFVTDQFLSTNKPSQIVQVFNLYLVAEIESKLVIIDQHAAHERILFEHFKKQFLDKKKDTKRQPLLLAVSIPVNQIEISAFEELKEVFEKIGFEIKLESDSSLLVTSIPQIFTDKNIYKIIKEVFFDWISEQQVKEINQQSEKALAYMACRTAVMAGDVLSLEMKNYLVNTLPQTPNHATCPHGRPTCIEISRAELDKMFKRS